MADTQHYGTGRRKTSTARVFIKPGKGDITVNKKPLDIFFGRKTAQMIVRQPLELTSLNEKFDESNILKFFFNFNIFNASLSKPLATIASKKVLLNQAYINIDDNTDELEKKVSDYKNSLLIYEYQQRLIDQNFDTTVLLDDLINYYNNNINEFKLDQDIFKGRYIIIDKNAPNIKSLYKLFRSSNDTDIDEMVSYCMLYAKEYYINDSIWNYFNPIKQKMPKSVSARNIFYSKRKYEIIEEDNFIYLLLFREFKFKGEISPFSIQKEKINRSSFHSRR